MQKIDDNPLSYTIEIFVLVTHSVHLPPMMTPPFIMLLDDIAGNLGLACVMQYDAYSNSVFYRLTGKIMILANP